MLARLILLLHTRVDPAGEDGFSTAELLGNAALGVAALVAIWQGVNALGVDLLAQIRTSLGL